eukprot:gnl/Hemi2/7149_TR2443_c0_g12_i1.p1 gnl/Hemi2/7149_TR2443_c0_g12~~gnl/Hemi2/7149_TR2443_c0_g12_i1.p1  ORF type:complete len:458 (+),score=63.57 gnl/Hemi2/7149_TR2443_c0_g12_i1:499-1872(+)
MLQLRKNEFTSAQLAEIRNRLTFEESTSLRPSLRSSVSFFTENDQVLLVPRLFPVDASKTLSYYPPASSGVPMRPGLRIDPALLRPEQRKATDVAFTALRQTPDGRLGGTTLCLACGMGKTVAAIYIGVELGARVLWLAHKKDLLEQCKRAIAHYVPAAKVQGLPKSDLSLRSVDADFVMGTFQAVHKRDYSLDGFSQFGLVVVDEGHHTGAPTFALAVMKQPARYVLALSATPERKDGRSELVTWLCGAPCIRITRDHSQVLVTMVRLPLYTGAPLTHKPYKNLLMRTRALVQLSEIEERSRTIAEKLNSLVLEEKRKVFAIAGTIAQGDNVAAFLDPRITTNFYNGKAEADHECDIVFTNHDKAAEGSDFPERDTLVKLSPGTNLEQLIGRIEREWPDKKPLQVWDFVDACAAFEPETWNRHRWYIQLGCQVRWTGRSEQAAPTKAPLSKRLKMQ